MGSLTGDELMKQIAQNNVKSNSSTSNFPTFGQDMQQAGGFVADAAKQGATAIGQIGNGIKEGYENIGRFVGGASVGGIDEGFNQVAAGDPSMQQRQLPEPNGPQQQQMGNAYYETSKLVAEAMRNRILDPKAVEQMPLDVAAQAYTQAIGTMQNNMLNPSQQQVASAGQVAVGKPEQFSQYGNNPDSSNMTLGVRQGQEAFDAARKRGGVGEPTPEEDPNAQINNAIDLANTSKNNLRDKTAPGGSFLAKIGNFVGDVGSALFTSQFGVELPGRAEKMAEARGMGGVGPAIAETLGKGQLPLSTKERMEVGTGRYQATASALKDQLSGIDATRTTLTTQMNNILAHPWINAAVGGQKAEALRGQINDLNNQYSKIQQSLGSLSFSKGTPSAPNSKSKAAALAKKYGRTTSEMIAMARKQQAAKNKGA